MIAVYFSKMRTFYFYQVDGSYRKIHDKRLLDSIIYWKGAVYNIARKINRSRE